MNKMSRRSFVPLLGTAIVGASSLSFGSTDFSFIEDSIKPKSLQKGDLIGVCAPAGGIKSYSEIKK